MKKLYFTMAWVVAVSCAGATAIDVPADQQDFLLSSSMASPIVLSLSPAQNGLNVSQNADITATFDVDIAPPSINDSTVLVSGNLTGLRTGSITYDASSKTVTFDPTSDFEISEVVTVMLTANIRSLAGDSLQNGFAWSFTVNSYSSTIGYPRRQDLRVGNGTSAVAIADMNGDGVLDIVATDRLGHGVSVLLNNGNGEFLLLRNIASDSVWPQEIALADFDRDHDIDVAVANQGSDFVTVFMNGGDGNLTSIESYAVGDGQFSICAADLTGDGYVDLATDQPVDDHVQVLINDRTGRFNLGERVPVAEFPTSITCGDWDNDGDMDLATACANDSVYIHINDGRGLFEQFVFRYSNLPLTLSSSVHAADVDSDGNLDLTTAMDMLYGRISSLLNDGSASFQLAPEIILGGYPFRHFHGDLDGDGDIDAATTNFEQNTASVVLNDGNGSFYSDVEIPVGTAPMGVAIADLDKDGSLDIVVANHHTDSVTVLFTTVSVPDNYTCGDINNDGIGPDISDLTHLIDYMFRNNVSRPVLAAADLDSSGGIDISDLTILVDYLFRNGPEPVCL